MFGRDHFAGHYGRLFFSPDDDGGGGGEPKPGDPKPDDKPKPGDPLEGLAPDIKTEVQRRIDAAASAARKAGEKDGLTKAQTDANVKAEADRVAKEQADLITAGKFEEAQKALEAKATTAEQRAKDAETLATAYEAALKPTIEARKKTIVELKIEGFPEEGTLIEQMAWLDDPRTVALIATTSESAKVLDAQGKPRVPRTPNANGTHKETDEEARLAQGRSYVNW